MNKKHSFANTYTINGVNSNGETFVEGKSSLDFEDVVKAGEDNTVLGVAFDAEKLQSIVIVSDKDVHVSLGESHTKGEGVDLKAGSPLSWNVNSYFASPFPSKGNVSLHVTNHGETDALVKASVLVN